MQSWRDHGRWRVRELLDHLGRYYQPYSTLERPRPLDPDELIERVGLTEQANHKISSLSGGQRRRMDVAIGIVGRPELLFLDEPTAGFDPQARRDFHDVVHRLADLEGTTILLTTHDLDEAEKLADRILILAGHRIVADGSADQLSRRVSAKTEVRWTAMVSVSCTPIRMQRVSSGDCSRSTARRSPIWRCNGPPWRTPTWPWSGSSRAAIRLVRPNLKAPQRLSGVSDEPMVHAARLGVLRGRTEFWQSLTNRGDQVWIVLINGIFLAVLFFQRNATVPGTDISLTMATLPSLLGMSIITSGWMNAATTLAAEREDGTLLRAKATPNDDRLHGRPGRAGSAHAGPVLRHLSDGRAVPGGRAGQRGSVRLADPDLGGAARPAGHPALGAIVGSLVKSSASGFGLSFLPISAMIAISGIFYPISGLPDWLHPIAQIFPVYWLGLGVRSALMPDSAQLSEIGDSWRHLETFGVLGIWAVVGLALAPRVLRRMAQRESGSAVEERRQHAMQMGY